MAEPRWLTPENVINIARAVVENTGEPFLVLNEGLLESAVYSPCNAYDYGGVRDLGELGLHLAVAIAKNHPFEQGNKRTGWFAMLSFWARNRMGLANDDHDYYADLFVDVITGEMPVGDFLVQLRLIEIY